MSALDELAAIYALARAPEEPDLILWERLRRDNPVPCLRCILRGKNWEGADPTCAFMTSTFAPENWNCATMNALRDLTSPDHHGVGSLFHAAIYNDDCWAAVIPLPEDPDGSGGRFLYLGWYKSRGRTAQAFVIQMSSGPRLLTLAEAERLLAVEEMSLR